VVPILPGLIGAWEPYTLGNADITVSAVYTPAEESNVPDVPPLPSEETDDTTDTADTTTPTDPDPADTVEPAKKGCRSSLSVGLLSALLLAAALTLGKKHDRQ
jgi:hypothetical protein